MGKAITDTFYPKTVIEVYHSSSLSNDISDGMYSNIIDMYSDMYEFFNTVLIDEGIESKIICADDPGRLTIGYIIYYEKDGVEHARDFSISLLMARTNPRAYFELLSSNDRRLWVCNHLNLRSLLDEFNSKSSNI